MPIIPRRVHGVLDYLVGAGLIAAPKLLGFDPGSAEARLPMMLGVATVAYSLCTRYELGALKVLPFRVHLVLDVLNGLLLTASPWLFDFADRVWVPHLALGLMELAVVMMTRSAPEVAPPRAPAAT